MSKNKTEPAINNSQFEMDLCRFINDIEAHFPETDAEITEMSKSDTSSNLPGPNKAEFVRMMEQRRVNRPHHKMLPNNVVSLSSMTEAHEYEDVVPIAIAARGRKKVSPKVQAKIKNAQNKKQNDTNVSS